MGTAGAVDGAKPRSFAFVVCGDRTHTQSVATAIRHLRAFTDRRIVVVTDSSRNEERIPHDDVIDVATPASFDNHQASIYLKTGLHRFVDLTSDWCYLDSDVIAVSPGADDIFEHASGPVTFASDLTIRENCVNRFSPWAMNCSCSGVGHLHSCSHLVEAIRERWGIEVPGDWIHWNGGVFLFGDRSVPFLDTWHERALETFEDPFWRTRDQGALIATAWDFGLHSSPRLPQAFNMIADLDNHGLCFDPILGYSLDPSGPFVHPRYLHLYTSSLWEPGWSLQHDVEAEIVRRMHIRGVRVQREGRPHFELANLLQLVDARTLRAWIRARLATARDRAAAYRSPEMIQHYRWLAWQPYRWLRRLLKTGPG